MARDHPGLPGSPELHRGPGALGAVVGPGDPPCGGPGDGRRRRRHHRSDHQPRRGPPRGSDPLPIAAGLRLAGPRRGSSPASIGPPGPTEGASVDTPGPPQGPSVGAPGPTPGPPLATTGPAEGLQLPAPGPQPGPSVGAPGPTPGPSLATAGPAEGLLPAPRAAAAPSIGAPRTAAGPRIPAAPSAPGVCLAARRLAPVRIHAPRSPEADLPDYIDPHVASEIRASQVPAPTRSISPGGIGARRDRRQLRRAGLGLVTLILGVLGIGTVVFAMVGGLTWYVATYADRIDRTLIDAVLAEQAAVGRMVVSDRSCTRSGRSSWTPPSTIGPTRRPTSSARWRPGPTPPPLPVELDKAIRRMVHAEEQWNRWRDPLSLD